MRPLNHIAAGGADLSEILQLTTRVKAGDAQGWYREWTDLGDRNVARGKATKDRLSRGEAFLRAHSYYTRAEFYLPPDDPKRPESFNRNRSAFYEGLDTLCIAYEKIPVPYGENTLNAIYYPAPEPIRAPLIMFCGGYDSIVEELYFFLVASARKRGYAVLTYEGPGQGAALREQGLRFTHEWEKPTSAVLDAYLAAHARPEKIVLIGLSMGGYLAPRAAAFESRIDGVVSYDIMFNLQGVHDIPKSAVTLIRLGLGKLVVKVADVMALLKPGLRWGLSNASWTMGANGFVEMVDTFGKYTLAGVAQNIRQDVLILAGAEDQFVPVEQVEQYKKALVNARSVTAKVYDTITGGHEHSQLGASTLWQADFFDWMQEKFG